MRRLAFLALLATTLVLPAAAQEPGTQGEAAFFCYWVDGAHKQAATTGLFRAPVEQSDAIAAQFAKAMQSSAKTKGRVYDCGYRRDPIQAEQDRQSLRSAHEAKGFAVAEIDWDPNAD